MEEKQKILIFGNGIFSFIGEYIIGTNKQYFDIETFLHKNLNLSKEEIDSVIEKESQFETVIKILLKKQKMNNEEKWNFKKNISKFIINSSTDFSKDWENKINDIYPILNNETGMRKEDEFLKFFFSSFTELYTTNYVSILQSISMQNKYVYPSRGREIFLHGQISYMENALDSVDFFIYDGLSYHNNINSKNDLFDIDDINKIAEPLKNLWSRIKKTFDEFDMLINPAIDYGIWRKRIVDEVHFFGWNPVNDLHILSVVTKYK